MPEPVSAEECGTMAPMDNSPVAQGRDQPQGDRHVDRRPPQEDADRARHTPAPRWWIQPPAGDRLPPIVGMRSIDRVAPETSDRMNPGNWDGTLLIGGGGPARAHPWSRPSPAT